MDLFAILSADDLLPIVVFAGMIAVAVSFWAWYPTTQPAQAQAVQEHSHDEDEHG